MNDDELATRCAASMFASDLASQALGISLPVVMTGYAEAEMTVRNDMLNGHNVCHGGLIFALADTAFAFACNACNQVTLAAGASIEFLHPAKAGDRLTAIASEQYRAGRSGVYDVAVTNQEGRQIALFRGRSHATGKPILGSSDTESLEKLENP
jgi:acyl-CoA thioesterase